MKERYITTGPLKKRKEARRLIAHQRYVVWHRNYGQCLCFFNIMLKYFITARKLPPYFIAARNVPSCLGVTGTAEGGTAIFYYSRKITAIFSNITLGVHLKSRVHLTNIGTAIFHYCEKITVIFRYCEKMTAIFRSTGNRKNRYRKKMKYGEPQKQIPPR